MLVASDTTKNHADARGLGVNLEPYGSQRATLSQVPCQSGCHGDIQTWAFTWNNVWVHGPITVRVCDVHGLWCHQKPHKCPGFRPDPVVMLVSKGCAATGGMVSSGLCLGPWSVLISMVHGTIKGNMDAKGLGLQLWPCWSLWATLPVEFGQSVYPAKSQGTELRLLPWAMFVQ